MSDHTVLAVRVLGKHHKRFEECLPDFEGRGKKLPNGWYDYFEDSADEGNVSELEKAAEAGVIFVGAHREGDNYMACIFASEGLGRLFITRATRDLKAFVEINDNGGIGGQPMVDAMKVNQVYQNLMEKATTKSEKRKGFEWP